MAFFICLFTTAYYHELVHQNIYSDYGIKSSIGFKIEGMYTIPQPYNLSYQNTISMMQAHELNEMITYPFQFLICIIAASVYTMTLMKILQE